MGAPTASLLLDAIEASYLAFRRRLRSIDQATTCDCNSCRLAPRLDLKLFIHHGSFVWSRIAGRDELAGSDVIVVHRLLKGTGAAEARANGFALFTAAAVDALGLDPEALGLRSGEEIDRASRPRRTFTLDLEARWQAESGERRLDIPEADVAFDVETTLAAEPSVVWAHLTSPALRTRWEGPIRIEETSAGGRRGVGTTAQCVTGRLATLEEIVDWQPYDRVAWRLAVPGLGPVAATADLDPIRERDASSASLGATMGGVPADADAVEMLRVDKEAAYARLATVIAGALPVVEHREVETMIPFRSEQTIDRSAMEVWEYAADIDRHPTWMSVIDARIVQGRPTEVGARAHRGRQDRAARRQTVEFEVAEADPGRRLA